MKAKLKYFGEVEFNSDFDELEIEEVKILDNKINIFVNIENFSEKKLKILGSFLTKLEDTVKNIKLELKNDYNTKGIDDYGVKSYLNHHLEEFNDEELIKLIDINKENRIEELFNNFYLKSISIFTENDEDYGIFDFTISEEMTDYVISVTLNPDGKVYEIIMES